MTTTPADVLRQARDALPEINPFDHPEHHAMVWTKREIAWIKDYAARASRASLAAIDALPSAPAADIDEAQLARLSERGAVAWAGVTDDDIRALRDGSAPSGEPAAPTRADLIAALTFYANGGHMNLSDESAWDTVSGEPQNWWCDEAGTATIEDGSLAKMALAGDMNADHFAALERGDDVCIQPEADRATTAPAPLSADQCGWLVEWRWNGVQWLYLTGASFSFTSDPSKALRFARRVDAESAMSWVAGVDRGRGLRPTGEMLVTEHVWCDPATPAAPKGQQ